MPRGTKMCQPRQLMQILVQLPGSSARHRKEMGQESRGRLAAGPDLILGPLRSSVKVAHHMVSQGGRLALPFASVAGRDEASETGTSQSHPAPIHAWRGWQVLLEKAPQLLSQQRDPSSPARMVTIWRWGQGGHSPGELSKR